MVEVDLSLDLLPRHRPALRTLAQLGRSIGTDDWCLVGGMMVLVAARAAGHRLPRAEQTKDADIVVDVCARASSMTRVTHELESLGYVIPTDAQDDPDFARCTFVSGNAQIDVLCPDDADPEDLDTAAGVRSLAIPGGRRALELSGPVRIFYDDDAFDVHLRVPLLPGAILVKASAAVDPRTNGQARHFQDVVGMLSILDDPGAMRENLSAGDREILTRLSGRLANENDVAWSGLAIEARLAAQVAAEILVS